VLAIDAKGGNDIDDAFVFIGTDVFGGVGQIRAVQSGTDTIVVVNNSGASGGEMQILLQNVAAVSLSSSDFIL
jgi:hypothetical protein